jgi:hypothetical protein
MLHQPVEIADYYGYQKAEFRFQKNLVSSFIMQLN